MPQWCVFYACTYKLHPFFGGEKLDLGSLFKIPVNFPFSLWYVRRFVVEGEHLRLYFVLKNHVPRQNFLKITPEMPSASPWNWRFHLFSTLFFLGTGWLVDDIIKCAQKPAFSLHVCQNVGCVESFTSFLYFQNRAITHQNLCISIPPGPKFLQRDQSKQTFKGPKGSSKSSKVTSYMGQAAASSSKSMTTFRVWLPRENAVEVWCSCFESSGNFHEIPMDFLEILDVIDDLWIKN